MSRAGVPGLYLPAAGRSGRSRVVIALLRVVGLLVALSLGTRYVAYRADVAAHGSERTKALISIMGLFDLNSETNVPTWFSSALLLSAAAATGLVAVMVRRTGGRDPARWSALAAVLALLSLDETSALHERLGGPAFTLVGDAAGHFAWVVPGAVFALLGASFFLGFVLRLPRPIRRHLLCAAAVFFGGAVVLEAVSGMVLGAQGDRAAYLLVTAAEESLEMVGAIWFLYAALCCLDLAADSTAGYRLTLVDDLRRSVD